MDLKSFTENAKKTLSPRGDKALHLAMGISTEAGELLDVWKKFLFYGKPIDMVNVKEEIGDLMWYVALLCDYFGFDLYDVFDTTIAKLQVRYPDKFRGEAAITRDLQAERAVLEKNYDTSGK